MGALFAGGTLLLVMQSRRARRPDARVLPYVQVTGFDWAREPAESSKWLSSEQLRRLLNSIVTDASVQRRLDQANSGIDLNAFRVDQLRWACFGAAGAIGFGLIRVLAHEPIPVPIWFLFTLGAAFAGAMLRDYRLSQEARRRIEVITLGTARIRRAPRLHCGSWVGPGECTKPGCKPSWRGVRDRVARLL